MRRRILNYTCNTLLLLLLSAGVYFCGDLLRGSSPAMAHGLYVFAWLEGDEVCAEGYYSSSRKMRNGTTKAFSIEGELLAEGLSDENGKWCFPIPDVIEITVVYMDGQGHRAEFALPLPERAPNAGPSPESTVVQPFAGEHSSAEISVPAAETAVYDKVSVPMSLVRQTIREEVAVQLEPLQHMLEERNKLGLREIVGLSGYVFGLLGMGLWAFGRRK